MDDQQQNVVVSDEDNTLVLAGAGSGKTLTIAGKVKYLCEEKNIKPEDILLISFTRKSAEEMTERISKLCMSVNATTFHKLGLDILKASQNESIDVFEDVSQYINNYFENKLISHPESIKILIEYFAYYLHIPANMDDFKSLGEAYDYERGMEFETIKSKYDKTQFVNHVKTERIGIKRTLQGEEVRSLEEVTIANFLFLNGIKYEYEAKYPYQTNDAKFKVYRPDFYLPDYDLYIEHFGVNKNGRAPWLSSIEETKYLKGMEWKREQHRENKTKLIETYSYYSSDGVLLKKLEELLHQNGVEFKEVDYQQIFNQIYQSQSDVYFSEFKRLCSIFIVLFKSNGYSESDLNNLANHSMKKNSYFQCRISLFLNFIKPLLINYDKFLTEQHMIDFSDMINKAADVIHNGFKINPYKYVIIDEYQDISVARYKLIKEIINQTHAKLLCVGDDWQSIFRFAGSDISLFTDFNKNCDGKYSVMRLEKTYRNSQELIDVAGDFIQRNPRQMHKQLVSDKHIDKPIVFWMYEDNPVKELEKSIEYILNDYGKTGSILLLGRTSYDSEILSSSGLFCIHKDNGVEKYIYNKSPETQINFMTIHKAKGIEADNVILLNFENSLLGFPNKISDDPMLELVLSSADDFMFGEERRLFYVAMTRTKNKFIVLTDKTKPSVFLDDIREMKEVIIFNNDGREVNSVSCPICKKGLLVIRKNEGKNNCFVGCSNYPQCDYTYHDIDILKNPKICSECGGFLIKRKGQFGKFYGCTNYPDCKYTCEE